MGTGKAGLSVLHLTIFLPSPHARRAIRGRWEGHQEWHLNHARYGLGSSSGDHTYAVTTVPRPEDDPVK